MIRRMVSATVGLAIYATVLGGVAAYLAYRLAIHTGLWYLAFPGPFSGWHNTWLWASAVGIVVGLPRALHRAYKFGPGRAPGGSMVSRGQVDDIDYLRKVSDWLEEHDDLEAVAAPGDRVHPPCLRCGRDVTGFKVKPDGLVVMRFKPCGCRVILSYRDGRKYRAARLKG